MLFRIADIQRDTGYSSKHFIALFRATTGLTPKHYYRRQRFTAALQRLAKGNAQNLADLAASLTTFLKLYLIRIARNRFENSWIRRLELQKRRFKALLDSAHNVLGPHFEPAGSYRRDKW